MQDQTYDTPADIAHGILQESPYHSLRQLACSYRDGVLVVAGCVPSFFLKQIAQTAVRDLDGVTQVENRIEVAG